MGADRTADAQGGQLLALVRRYLGALIGLAVLGTAAGVVLEMAVPPPFKATATVLVSPLEGNPYSPEGRGDDLVNLQTEAQLVATDSVAKIVEKKLGHEAEGDIGVSVPPNTQVLNLTYTASSSGNARAGAQAFADAYLEYRTQRAQGVVNNQLAKLKAQSARVERLLQRANNELAASSGSRRSTLQQRVTAYTNQLGVIDEQSNDIASTPLDPGQVITPADAPAGPGIVRPAMYGAGGLVLGLVAGFVIMLLRERLNQRLRNAESIEGLGVRTLSAIPAGGPSGDTLALVSAPKSPVGEAYRRLRAAVVATAPQTPVALLISNATPGGSARMASANLAVSLAFAGAKTIMIDATTEDADVSTLFGARPGGKGLSDTLLSGTDPATLLIHTDSQLRLLPRGPRAREAAHRFSGPRMRETVKVLRRRSEYLIVNAASLHDADAQALCTFVDAVVLVINQGVTTREELRQAYVEAERAGVTVLGALLEPPEPRGGRGTRQAPAARQSRPPQGGEARPPQGGEARPPQGGEARPPQGGEARGGAEPRLPETRGGKRRAPEAPLAWAEDPPRASQDEPAADPADSPSLVTQALPQVTQPPRTGEARPAPSGRRGAPQPEPRRRPLPPALDPPSGPGKPVAPKPVSPTEVTQGTGPVRPRPAAPSDAEPPEPADAETEETLESAATRTQEDISKFMPPELPEDGADGTPPAGPKDAAPDVAPRYGKKPHKAGRHAGP
ncbi:tyrosine-protein kinase domain-containing protein [Actinomadura mexicana]|uniref:Chromosome partitioning ATPase, Mrp family, contains Fe-S cluster n=1 Tax=Actinomadura mexicana TaxID=134959 RepID=A0A238WUR4_9ACTN|nr:tyrosine-protein kinase domain-containing protein [Actinomadura mexicana]SNR49944.1 Chromosome partitioning ATPase, Mrp family, contains Fe-S cluster [Actinomadura mexicana]